MWCPLPFKAVLIILSLIWVEFTRPIANCMLQSEMQYNSLRNKPRKHGFRIRKSFPSGGGGGSAVRMFGVRAFSCNRKIVQLIPECFERWPLFWFGVPAVHHDGVQPRRALASHGRQLVTMWVRYTITSQNSLPRHVVVHIWKHRNIN